MHVFVCQDEPSFGQDRGQRDVDSVILLISAAGRQILLSCRAYLLRLGKKMSLAVSLKC